MSGELQKGPYGEFTIWLRRSSESLYVRSDAVGTIGKVQMSGQMHYGVIGNLHVWPEAVWVKARVYIAYEYFPCLVRGSRDNRERLHVCLDAI